MQDNLIPISLPFSDPPGASVRVFVVPEKTYGKHKGIELFERYGVGVHRSKETKPHSYIHWTEDDNLWVFGNILKGNTEMILNLSRPFDVAIITTLFFPPDELPKKIRIGRHFYKLKDIVHIMEDVLDTKILYRYSNSVIKAKVNTSIEVSLQPVEKGLVIFGRKGYSYLLKKGEGVND
jgi:hypothetical protein